MDLKTRVALTLLTTAVVFPITLGCAVGELAGYCGYHFWGSVFFGVLIAMISASFVQMLLAPVVGDAEYRE